MPVVVKPVVKISGTVKSVVVAIPVAAQPVVADLDPASTAGGAGAVIVGLVPTQRGKVLPFNPGQFWSLGRAGEGEGA